MARFLFTIQYLGTRYAGWQSQKNGLAVQQVVERALAKLCGTEVVVFGAGRTDSGVHARGQRAHADVPIEIRPEGLLLGLNTLLPDDVRISETRLVDDELHARYHAIGKTYVYRIWNSRIADVFHSRTHALIQGPLDEALMRSAGQKLVGEHDFRSFTVARPSVRSTVRTIHSLEVTREGTVVTLTISGTGFLRYMVRRIVGLLVEIGGGRLDPSYLEECLEPRFGEVRWSAPAEGLTLDRVDYGDRLDSAGSALLT